MYGRDHDFEVVQIEEEEVRNLAISSTRIRNALADNNIELTNELLGHPFMIKGKVVTGNRLGHHIGYPTANVRIADPKKLLPQDGIFAATATFQGVEHKGMLYIGLRPSIEAGQEHRVEIHLFDFDKQVYDEEITVEIYKFIRGDRKFPTMESLQAAMQEDERVVRHYFKGSPKEHPPVATAILNYNGKKFLERFLPFFDASRYPNEQIYVIDNASTDGSVKWVKGQYPHMECISLASNLGYAGGYNEGLAQIDAKYFAIVNSDIEITSQWLDPIIKLMESDPKIAAVQPKILAEGRRGYFEYAGAAGGFMDSLDIHFAGEEF